eukprot:2269225-Prymnesium_polylepis.1
MGHAAADVLRWSSFTLSFVARTLGLDSEEVVEPRFSSVLAVVWRFSMIDPPSPPRAGGVCVKI